MGTSPRPVLGTTCKRRLFVIPWKKMSGENVMEEKTVNMTSGPVLSRMVKFALPVLLGLLCQRIYNFADAYIVGHFLGDRALAAVSIAGTATYLLFSVIMGLTTGVSVVMSHHYGAGETDEVVNTFSTSVAVCLFSALIITAAGVIAAEPLLKLLQTSGELMPEAVIYLEIMFAGAGGTMLYNWIASVLRSLGNSLVPLVFLVISSALNVILDLAWVVWIPMGVAGAAGATVAAQMISGILCLLYARKAIPFLRLSLKNFRCQREKVKAILVYGVPTGLQMSIISVSDMTLQAVVNTYSTALVVAYGVCLKVEGLGFQLADAIGTSLGTFVGQNVGAGRLDRAKKGVRCAYLMNIVCYGVFCPLVFAGAPAIMRLFTDTAASVEYGVEYMRIFSLFFLAGGILVVYHNVLRPAGDVKVTILMGVSEVVTRIGCAFGFSALWGYYGLWWVSPVTWICAALLGGVRYYSGSWEEKARKQRKMEGNQERGYNG